MPARMSSENPLSKNCFRKLPLIYHPKGLNKAPYNSEITEDYIFFFDDKDLE